MITRYALLTAIVVCIVLSFALYLSTKTDPKIEDQSPRIAKLEAEKATAQQKAMLSETRARELSEDVKRINKGSTVAREKLKQAEKNRAEVVASVQPPPILPLWAQEKIEAQDELITSLELELSAEIAKTEAWQESSDNWKKAFQQSERQIECLKIAHEAHLKAVHASRWKGRLEGFVIGAGVGFIGGKLP